MIGLPVTFWGGNQTLLTDYWVGIDSGGEIYQTKNKANTWQLKLSTSIGNVSHQFVTNPNLEGSLYWSDLTHFTGTNDYGASWSTVTNVLATDNKTQMRCSNGTNFYSLYNNGNVWRAYTSDRGVNWNFAPISPAASYYPMTSEMLDSNNGIGVYYSQTVNVSLNNANVVYFYKTSDNWNTHNYITTFSTIKQVQSITIIDNKRFVIVGKTYVNSTTTGNTAVWLMSFPNNNWSGTPTLTVLLSFTDTFSGGGAKTTFYEIGIIVKRGSYYQMPVTYFSGPTTSDNAWIYSSTNLGTWTTVLDVNSSYPTYGGDLNYIVTNDVDHPLYYPISNGSTTKYVVFDLSNNIVDYTATDVTKRALKSFY